MKPLAWSHSSLEDFVNCPRAFHAKRIIKTVKQEQGVEAKWGEMVHTHFEQRQKDGVILPDFLAEHEPFMKFISDKPGIMTTEQKIGLNLKLQGCGFFDKDVWFRGVIDFRKVDAPIAFVLDYKTGKPHAKFRQLKLFALYTFLTDHTVDLVNAQYYWTKTKSVTKAIYGREDVPALWADVMPDLKQYREAFATDTWQPRQSGLCKAHCPVLGCEFNGRR